MTLMRNNLFKTWLGAVLVSLTFTSCDNDVYSVCDFGIAWATVHTLGGTQIGPYYLQSDAYGSLWLSGNNVNSYVPTNGQRVIAMFNPLADNYEGYNMAVVLNWLTPVETKNIIQLTNDNVADFGNDPLVVYQGNMWVAGGYLNLVYQNFVWQTTAPTINLVYSADDALASDDYVHLQLLYKNSEGNTSYVTSENVSFDLSTIDLTDKKGIMLAMNSLENGEVELVINIENGVGGAVPAN